MAFIKTTNNILIESIQTEIKTVQCPHCHTYIKGVPEYITAMHCWYCKKEFRLQQDTVLWESDYLEPGIMKRTAHGAL